MLNNLTYKQKNWLLLAGIVFFSFIVYFMAIVKTIDMASQCAELEEQIKTAGNAPGEIARLEAKLQELDAKAGVSSDNVEFQQALLERVTTYCSNNRVSLKEFPANHVYTSNEVEVETNQLKVEGGFSNLLNLVFSLEQTERIGRVISVCYETQTDVRTKRVSLTAKIYVQNVQKTASSL